MEIVMKQYQRKPFVVEAVRIDRTNFQAISDRFDGVITWRDGIVESQGSPIGPEAKVDPNTQYIYLETHNPTNDRQTRAHVGDWVLVTHQGIKIYHNRSFIAQFELVEEVEKTDIMQGGEVIGSVPGRGETNFGGYRRLEDSTNTEPKATVSPEMQQAVETIEAEGGTVEEATPEGVADAVKTNEEAMAESDALDVTVDKGEPEHQSLIDEIHNGPETGREQLRSERIAFHMNNGVDANQAVFLADQDLESMDQGTFQDFDHGAPDDDLMTDVTAGEDPQ